MRLPTLIVSFVAAGLLLAGCGQKGPLYLPDEASAQAANAPDRTTEVPKEP
ncbi:MAG: LPS translocon maturation chaperone LptM [Halothiobacillaceae bacterium]